MIGIRFTLISLLLTITVLVPVYSVMLGVGLQYVIRQILGASRPVVITTTIVILFILLLLSLLFTVRSRKDKELNNQQVKMVMAVQYIIIQPLGFYLLWAIFLDFQTDGQIMWAAVVSHPVSSFWFIAVGIY